MSRSKNKVLASVTIGGDKKPSLFQRFLDHEDFSGVVVWATVMVVFLLGEAYSHFDSFWVRVLLSALGVGGGCFALMWILYREKKAGYTKGAADIRKVYEKILDSKVVGEK